MTDIKVNLGDRTYDVLIQTSCGEQMVIDFEGRKLHSKFAIVSDSSVAELYGKRFLDHLKSSGFDCDLFVFPSGEKSKTLTVAAGIVDEMLAKGYSRSDLVVALGGGVTGDLAGFVAAIFMRGIDFVQIPTSLLAMTDAAIGGKTGVNTEGGKNLIGAFHQPLKVYVDVQFLRTLPLEEMKNGYAEIVKHAVIGDEGLFEMIEEASVEDLIGDFALLERILRRSCKVKTDIVSRDERESRERMFLNLGHTVGHAIEKVVNYEIGHGFAVSIGLSRICDLSVRRGLLSGVDFERINEVLVKLGLPIAVPAQINVLSLLEIMKGDKKVRERRLNFILPKRIGEVVICDDVTSSELKAVL